MQNHPTPQTKSNLITILIADDHPIIRQAIGDLIKKEADMVVIAEAQDGEQAVQLCIEKKPQIVLMDIGMPRLNGLEATRLIKVKCPKTAILVLTIHNDSENILGILQAGAAGFLTKSVFGQELIQAIRSVAVGESVLTGAALRQILIQATRSEIQSSDLPVSSKLSAKEQMILKLVARGLSNKEIATALNISPLTAKGYLDEIFSKMNVNSRTEAVVKALQAGFLTLSEIP
jgi:DNA-binding NarL/FixJ family response regulator